MGRIGGSVFGAQTHVTSLVLIVSIVMRPDLKRAGGPTTPISRTLQKTTYNFFLYRAKNKKYIIEYLYLTA